MKLDKVLDHKGSTVETIRPDQTVRDLVQRLTERRIGALVVSEDGQRVLGMASERDVVNRLTADGPAILDSPVSAIMTTTITSTELPALESDLGVSGPTAELTMTTTITCTPVTATTADLMELMTNSRIRHVPVVDDDENLIGLVSIGDVVKSRLGELKDERDALIQYVTVGG
jgi:CBS domain-containing protein